MNKARGLLQFVLVVPSVEAAGVWEGKRRCGCYEPIRRQRSNWLEGKIKCG